MIVRKVCAFMFLLSPQVFAFCELDQLPRAEPSLQEKILYSSLPDDMTQMPPSPLWVKGKKIARTALNEKDQQLTDEEILQCRKNIVDAERLFRFNDREPFFDPRWPIVLLVAVEHGMYEFARDAWIAQVITVKHERGYSPKAWNTRAERSYSRFFDLKAVDLYSEQGFRKALIRMVIFLEPYAI